MSGMRTVSAEKGNPSTMKISPSLPSSTTCISLCEPVSYSTMSRQACGPDAEFSFAQLLHNRQLDAGWMLWIVVDGIVGNRPSAVVVERLAGIGVRVKAWEVAAGDVEAKTVPPLEDQGSRVHFDRKSIHLAGFHQRGLLQRVTVAGAY